MEPKDPPSYFILNTADVQYPGGPLQLGSIILSPRNLPNTLNPEAKPKITSKIYNSFTAAAKITAGQDIAAAAKLKTKLDNICHKATNEIEVSYENHTGAEYILQRLKTYYFQPELDFASRSFYTPEVISHLTIPNVSHSPAPKEVYMITGLKVAEGKTTISRGHEVIGTVKTKWQLKTAVKGMLATITAKTSKSATARVMQDVEQTTNFVVAYRLLKLKSWEMERGKIKQDGKAIKMRPADGGEVY